MNHGTKKDVDLFLLAENQFAVVSAHAFHWITAIHRAAAFAEFASLLFRSVRTPDDVFRSDTQCLQEAHPELAGRPDIQDFGNADAQLRAILRWRRDGRLLCEPGRQHSERHFSSSRSRS